MTGIALPMDQLDDGAHQTQSVFVVGFGLRAELLSGTRQRFNQPSLYGVEVVQVWDTRGAVLGERAAAVAGSSLLHCAVRAIDFCLSPTMPSGISPQRPSNSSG
jgi:hypothetical protein